MHADTKLCRALTISAVLLDGVGGQLNGVLAGILLREHQLLHLALRVQDSYLQDCVGRGRRALSVYPQTGFMLNHEAQEWENQHPWSLRLTLE